VLNRVGLVNKPDLLHQLGHALADICQVIALVGTPSRNELGVGGDLLVESLKG